MSTLDEKGSDGAGPRSRALRSLLYAAAITPILLVPDASWRIVSPEAAVGAILLGGVAGIATALAFDGVAAGRASTPVVTALAIVGVCVATVGVWLVVPPAHTPAFLQFALAFVWSSALASCLRHVVVPRLATPDGR